MARTKKVIVSQVNEDDYLKSLGVYASAEARKRKINAEIDIQTLRIKDKFSQELGVLEESLNNNFSIVQKYCEENEHLFGDKKSIDTTYGAIGFRTGTPALKTLKGFTWASVCELVKRTLSPDYVRVKEEVAKDVLLSDRDKLDLRSIGLKVEQDETFYINIKEE